MGGSLAGTCSVLCCSELEDTAHGEREFELRVVHQVGPRLVGRVVLDVRDDRYGITPAIGQHARVVEAPDVVVATLAAELVVLRALERTVGQTGDPLLVVVCDVRLAGVRDVRRNRVVVAHAVAADILRRQLEQDFGLSDFVGDHVDAAVAGGVIATGGDVERPPVEGGFVRVTEGEVEHARIETKDSLFGVADDVAVLVEHLTDLLLELVGGVDEDRSGSEWILVPVAVHHALGAGGVRRVGVATRVRAAGDQAQGRDGPQVVVHGISLRLKPPGLEVDG